MNCNYTTPQSWCDSLLVLCVINFDHSIEPDPRFLMRGTLNQVEIELSILSQQCLERRIPDVETLFTEIAA
jgi:hypothetical protein